VNVWLHDQPPCSRGTSFKHARARRCSTLVSDSSISAACWEFIHGPLAENPRRVGKPLLEPLAPQYSARRGGYRVLYLIEDEQVTIAITSVTHRADAYRTP
jgi:mRNA interferase RelE/StbE